jgi:hypothetical protein
VSQEDWARSGLAGHDLIVTVERLTAPPGARLPAFVPDVRAPRVFAVAAGVAQAVILTSSGATPPPAERVGPGQVLRFRTLGAGERLQLHNPEAQPLVLLQVTLGADQTATPETEPPRPRKWPVSAPDAVPSRSQGMRPQIVRWVATPSRLADMRDSAWSWEVWHSVIDVLP